MSSRRRRCATPAAENHLAGKGPHGWPTPRGLGGRRRSGLGSPCSSPPKQKRPPPRHIHRMLGEVHGAIKLRRAVALQISDLSVQETSVAFLARRLRRLGGTEPT